MNSNIIKRVIEEANYIIKTEKTIREIASIFNVSKSTVHKDLHERLLEIDEKTFLSIKSNYNIYLKENVDKYIELKNKLTEFIMNTSNQINDVIGNFIGNFEKNIVAFITFILGTIIANVVSDSPLDNILTKDVITIILAILAGSLVYL